MPDPTPAFTAFGRVTAAIAGCEQLMRLALGSLEVEKAKRAGNGGAERFTVFTARMLGWDFGQLAHRVRTQFKLPDDPWIQIFKDAKEMRNNVAHEFWSPNYGLLRSERGIGVIVRHCDVLRQHFEHLGDGLAYVTGLNLDTYFDVINDPASLERAILGFEERIVEAEEAVANFIPWTDKSANSAP